MFSQFSKLSNRHGDLICHQGSMICSRLYIFTFSPLFPVSKFHCLHKTFYQRFSLLSIYARNIPRSLAEKIFRLLVPQNPWAAPGRQNSSGISSSPRSLDTGVQISLSVNMADVFHAFLSVKLSKYRA